MLVPIYLPDGKLIMATRIETYSMKKDMSSIGIWNFYWDETGIELTKNEILKYYSIFKEKNINLDSLK
jgi:hypothetical protein